MKLDFRTDFSSLLKAENKINHTVKVVTKSEVIECSGAVLCQHSDILLQLVAKDNELFLDNYSHVQDCLLVLHGAEVALNMDNILDLMKFSVQFGINEIYLQCLDWIENNFSEENVLEMYKICNSVSKFARLCGVKLPTDAFCHVITYLIMVGPNAVINLFNTDSEATQLDFLRFFLGTKGFMSNFDDLLCDIISENNISIVLPLLCDNFDELKKFSEKHFCNLITRIDCTSVASLAPKDYVCYKEKLLSMFLQAQSPYNTSHSLLKGVISLTDTILHGKLWKKMNKDQIIDVQRLFETPSQHFIYSEIMIAWISENKPTQETVTELYQTLKPYKLGADYISLLNDKCKALGYIEPISATLLATWKPVNHYITDVVYGGYTNTAIIMQFKISCRSTCNSSQLYTIELNQPKDGRGLEWSWRGGTYPSTVTDDFLKCPLETVQGGVEKERFTFYGANKDDVHLQFHTDWTDALAKWKTVQGQHVKVGCVQFGKISK